LDVSSSSTVLKTSEAPGAMEGIATSSSAYGWPNPSVN
jgi:hypothetical protein